MVLPPNEFLLCTVFKICSSLNTEEAIEFGKQLYRTLPKQYAQHVSVLNSALHMFMKHADMIMAEQLFSTMKKNVITAGTMMSGRSMCCTSFNDRLELHRLHT
jgi:hypothetical protein